MRTLTLTAIATLAIFGCGDEREQPEGTTTAPGEPTTGGEVGEMDGMDQQAAISAICPVEVQGTTVQAENVEGGAALVFMTSGDVEELRERVRHYAAMQEAEGMRSAQMGMPGTTAPPGADREEAGAKAAEPMGDEQQGEPQMGGGIAPGAGGTAATDAMPQVNTRVEDIEGGARLIFIPMESGALDSVRTEVQDQALSMTGGECPQMYTPAMQPEAGPYQ